MQMPGGFHSNLGMLQMREVSGYRLQKQPATYDTVDSNMQGDTAETRRMQTSKYRRQARLDGLPPWDTAADGQLSSACNEASQGLCFCVVKHWGWYMHRLNTPSICFLFRARLVWLDVKYNLRMRESEELQFYDYSISWRIVILIMFRFVSSRCKWR